MKLLMTLNRYLLFVLMFLGAWGYDVYAQNTMSDEQVMKFVIKENENGTSQQQIVTKLMQRGVTIEQIRRIKSKYDKQKDGSVMGAKDITGAAEDRMRVNNGGKKQQNRRDLQKKDLRKKKDLTEYQKRLQREDDELEFYDEISFMMISRNSENPCFMVFPEETDTPKPNTNANNKALMTPMTGGMSIEK